MSIHSWCGITDTHENRSHSNDEFLPAEFKFLHKSEAIQAELALYWHVVLSRDKAEMEKGKLNSNVHQNPIKLIMNFTLFLLARFTQMGLLLRLMNGSCGME